MKAWVPFHPDGRAPAKAVLPHPLNATSITFRDSHYHREQSISSKFISHGINFATFYKRRKLIGARIFYKGFEAVAGALNDTQKTARDTNGHGTHTLSTAGGAFVPRASLFGFGNGTAKGGSPKARVAAYRVCWGSYGRVGCYGADILAAFDAAISDGVDVISISISGLVDDYFYDGIALGSLHAVKNGISVVCSAGNRGPFSGTVGNVAPWIFTVAASTMDREFSAYATLGNGEQLKVFCLKLADSFGFL